MPVINYTDALVIALYTLGLFWGVLAVTVILERKRQIRLPYYFTPIINFSLSPHRHDLQPPRIVTQELRRMPTQNSFSSKATALAFAVTDPLRSQHSKRGTAEQIVIHIEPDGLPSDERKNIQRLIDHLQSMATDKAAS